MKMFNHGFVALAFLAVSGCSTVQKAPEQAVKDLAPTGKLRAAINFGNLVLALERHKIQGAGVAPAGDGS